MFRIGECLNGLLPAPRCHVARDVAAVKAMRAQALAQPAHIAAVLREHQGLGARLGRLHGVQLVQQHAQLAGAALRANAGAHLSGSAGCWATGSGFRLLEWKHLLRM